MSSHEYNTRGKKRESSIGQDNVLANIIIANDVSFSIGKLRDEFINLKNIIIKRLQDDCKKDVKNQKVELEMQVFTL